MSGKRVSSKHKLDRRMGANIWGRAKSPVNKRQTGPGMHGARRGKPTDYGLQLFAKQKLKGYYGNITEKQFKKIFKEAERIKGDTSEVQNPKVFLSVADHAVQVRMLLD